ncbi:hypothetical protein ACIPQH_25210 [Streptomyces rubiginosohelvolus]|uniref:hypothetical protein n=1 Tax=Streptomyces rubiginosohelvolus TaxID=67362 RepID=UPI00382B9584
MWEQWGTVVGALIGFGGLFVGLLVGRRQVTDEAKVEHEQWLRGQRQEAYAQLLDAWDTGWRATRDVVEHPEKHDEAEARGWNWGEDIIPAIIREVSPPWEPFWRAVERVELLGPQSAVGAAEGLRRAAEEAEAAALDFTGMWPNRDRFEAAKVAALAARRKAVTAVGAVLQEAPSPAVRRGRGLPRQGG